MSNEWSIIPLISSERTCTCILFSFNSYFFQLKQQITENADLAEKEKVVLNSEIESLKSTVKDLNSCIKTQKLTNKIERETMNDIHLQTITVSTMYIQ